jgi:sugar phosphate isomerase/epimerase
MDRRAFIKTGGAITGAAALGLLSQMANSADSHYPFGIQLYSLRDDLPNNSEAILRDLAQSGYLQIESYEGPEGMFWGKSPTAFASFVRSLGMDLVSSHCSIGDGFERKAEQAAEAGMRYLICPLIGPQPSLDDYRRFADTFNRCGEICRSNGLRFAYHNHHYTFFDVGAGATEAHKPQDILMLNTDPELVDFQLDIFWLVAAGEDPLIWLQKYPGRFPLSHVKDRLANMPGDSFSATTTLGRGIIDYPAILPVAYANGMRWFMVEQESYAGTTPLESSRDNAAYMKQFSFG